MEWNRGDRPTQPAAAPVNHETGTHSAPAKKTRKVSLSGLRLASVFLLFAGTALIVFVLLAINRLGGDGSAKALDKGKMQAVFLNGGQVYFGKISDINAKNIQLKDIYYLRVNQQVQPNQTNSNSSTTTGNDISLVKLGCELHGPQDSMVINQEQVIFWENLKSDGQVAKAVEEYKKSNPGDQKCDTGSQTQQTGSGTGTQQQTNTGTTNNTTTNKPATGTTTR